MSDIVRIVEVDRSRLLQELFDALPCMQLINRDALCCMPSGEGDRVEVVLFEPLASECSRPGFMSRGDRRRAYLRRGLAYDPHAVMRMNELDETFAVKHPHIGYWEDGKHGLCYVAFGLLNGGRAVDINCCDFNWSGDWRYAGSRKIGS